MRRRLEASTIPAELCFSMLACGVRLDQLRTRGTRYLRRRRTSSDHVTVLLLQRGFFVPFSSDSARGAKVYANRTSRYDERSRAIALTCWFRIRRSRLFHQAKDAVMRMLCLFFVSRPKRPSSRSAPNAERATYPESNEGALNEP